MAYAYPGAEALDYRPCHYGRSRLLFRGPGRDLDLPYVAALGGTETYGKFIPAPWPVLLEDATGWRMVNLGCVNAGVDAYLSDPEVLRVVQDARLAVVQLTGAGNLSNRYYAVHPRRNDRFLRAHDPLASLFPEVDFTNFHFTRHLLMTLHAVSAQRFALVAEELRRTWLSRMAALVKAAKVPVVLLWLDPAQGAGPADPFGEPLLVDATMVAALKALVRATVRVDAPAGQGLEDMAFAPFERPAAEGLPGPPVHEAAAAALAEALERVV